MKNRLIVLILAARGDAGSRSAVPMALHPLLGTSSLRLTLEAVRKIHPARVLVASGLGIPGAGTEIISRTAVQGPAAALRAARKELARDRDGDVLIVPADTPLIRAEVLKTLVARHRKRADAGTILSVQGIASPGSDRIVQEDGGRIRIVAGRKAASSIGAPVEIITGFAVFRIGELLRVWPPIVETGDAGGFSLSGAVAALSAAGRSVGIFKATDPEDYLRLKTNYDLGLAADLLRLRKIRELAESGVEILSPATTWIDFGVAIGPGTVVYPGAVIEGSTVIGRNGRIYPGAHIVDAVLGDGVHVFSSTVIEAAVAENDVRIGPFARIRMNTILRSGSRVGNFVEMKKTDFGPKAKAMHLSYLGDSEVGESANIGAGTITCNFDGVKKNRTVIGAGAFIGSGSELIAPVRIGRGAYVAAGSVITKNVADDALAVARGRQIEKPGWAAARRAKIQAAGPLGPKTSK
jgi:bifunctional UDP-N-acetylglucosamine pyrophosphorylase/glucosamine-1-phosphate N-acetyltransferase